MPARRKRDLDLRDQLVLAHDRIEVAAEEVSESHLALALDAREAHRRAEREQRAGRIRGVVGLREHPADGGHAADAHVADPAEDVRDEREAFTQRRVPLERRVGDERAEADSLRLLVELDPIEARSPPRADERLGPHEPLPDEQRQRGAARDDLRVRPALSQELEGLGERFRLEELHRGSAYAGAIAPTWTASRGPAGAAREVVPDTGDAFAAA